MGRAVKITLILAFVGVVVVAAIATTLVFHFKGKTDSAAESNLTTTIQQSRSMTSSTRDSSSSSRVSTITNNVASSTTAINGATTTMNPVTTVSTMSTTRISTSTIQNVPINLTGLFVTQRVLVWNIYEY
ncbi:hypothetical protein I4U23_016681 [Adineta vaga]|nr:hypothetical protein I4U23_016681 [Adineta vaga]